jgi:multidrug efflux pump subunit AcrA (membrane-fusion protein)
MNCGKRPSELRGTTGGALAALIWAAVCGVLLQGAPPAAAAESQTPAPAGPPGSGERKVAVTDAPIRVRSVQRSVGAVGSFFGYDEITVTAEVIGRVARIHHDVGDLVAPGALLLEIDPTDYNLAFEETLRALQLEVARVLNPLPPDEDFDPERALQILARFKPDDLPSVVRAIEQEKNARARYQRAKQLHDSRSVSDEEYDQRATDWEVARTGLTQARLDGQAILAGIRHRLVLLRIAKRKLELTRVTVPRPTPQEGLPADVKFAVVERKVAEGEILKDSPSSSTATFRLVIDGVLKLKATVPERFAAQVQHGQKAEVRVDAYPDKVFAGVVQRINPMIDRKSRTFTVEINVDNKSRELKAGGFAKADILTRVDPQAWTVPVEAIVTYAGSVKVFVNREGYAHAVPVATGIEGRGWVELIRSVSPDLRADDRVITSGQEKLAEGVAVFVRSVPDEGARTKE